MSRHVTNDAFSPARLLSTGNREENGPATDLTAVNEHGTLTDHHALQKRCQFVKKQIKEEQRAIGDLEYDKQSRQAAQKAAPPGHQKPEK